MGKTMKRPNRRDYLLPDPRGYGEIVEYRYQVDLERYANHAERILETVKDKKSIISSIEQRIKDERRKHPTLEWEQLAAIKIYIGLFEDSVERIELNKGEVDPK